MEIGVLCPFLGISRFLCPKEELDKEMKVIAEIVQFIRKAYTSKGGSGLELGGRLEAWRIGTFAAHFHSMGFFDYSLTLLFFPCGLC